MRTTSVSGLLRGLVGFLLLAFALGSQADDKGLLWKLQSPGGKVSYLFGTMHSDDARVNDFSPQLRQAFTDSDEFMMEILPPQDVSIYFMKNQSLRDLLTEPELAQLNKLADFHAMPSDVATHMKPWLLAMAFDLPKPQSPYTQDVVLYTHAQEQSKQILPLEEAAEHFGMLDSFSQEDQLTMLRAVLKRSQEAKEKDFEALLTAYLSRDTAKIAALDDRITGGMLPGDLWDRMKVKLIDERNARMAERIAKEAGDNSVFVAVGASHLPGSKGLLARLRAAGYQVSAVE